MKQTKNVLLLVTVAAISACSETRNMEFAPIDDSGHTLICANIESLLLMEESRIWPEGAAIGVYGSEAGENECYLIKNADAGADSAVFYGPLVKGTVAAYYPYSETFVGNVNAMPVSVEKVQVYDPEADVVDQYRKYTPYAYGYLKDGKVSFVYPNGIFGLTFGGQEADYITDISLSSDSLSISGLGAFIPDGTLVMSETTYSVVTLNCGEGVPTISDGEANVFYFVVVPGTYSDLRLSIGFKGDDKKSVIHLPEITIERVSSSMFNVGLVKISDMGPDGFYENKVQFDE